jgi:glycosyltransferase involved in cell wall biosynthesis
LKIPAIKGGGWLVALSQALAQNGAIDLGVASCVSNGSPIRISAGGIQHFTVPVRNKSSRLLRPTKDTLSRYQDIVDQFSPDLIHVHGTEWFGGLVTAENRMARPTIVALQGLIDHHRRYLLGHLDFLDILKSRTLWEWIMFSGLWKERLLWNKRAALEREIIRGHETFEGRSLWDRAHLRRLNPGATYFYCDHIIRKEFYDREWTLPEAKRHSILAPAGSYPLKGFHILVKAAAILRREFPDVVVRYPIGSFPSPSGIRSWYSRMGRDGYSNYLAGLIKKLGIGDHIFGIVIKSGGDMAEEMQHAHVFALTSLVENNSNAMAEALVVGVPSVVSLGGGIPSLIDDGKSVLGFPPGDEAVLAEQIRRIFLDDNLALQLSRFGKATERARHAPAQLVQRMTEIYKAVARGEKAGYLELPPDREGLN